jgi:replicative superfamily II helicase
VADLRRNFSVLFEKGRERDDMWIVAALARIDSFRNGVVSNAEADDIGTFPEKVDYSVVSAFGGSKAFTPYAYKIMFCYDCLLKGTDRASLSAVTRGLQWDSERVIQVLRAIDGMSTRWGKSEYLTTLVKRLRYGVSWHLLDLCEIPGIAKVRSQKLYKAGIDTPAKVIANPARVKAALRCSDKMLEKVIEGARKLV